MIYYFKETMKMIDGNFQEFLNSPIENLKKGVKLDELKETVLIIFFYFL